MSGGAYNYLYRKDEGEILAGGCDEDLQQMADRLAGLGYANDAARETQEVLLIVRQYRNRLNNYLRRLAPLWRAVEWVDSGDSTEDWIADELTKYREGPE